MDNHNIMKQTRPENTRTQLLFFVFHMNSVPSYGSDIVIGLIFIDQEVIYVLIVPMEHNKRRRIDGNDSASNTVGEGLIELEVLSISGECMLTLNVGRLHAWSWVVEDDFGQNSTQAGPSVGCVPYFKACAAWKSATTRTWGWTGTGVGYLHARQFACCLAFCHGGSVEDEEFSLRWDNRNDRGWWWNACLAAQFAQEPSHLDICTWL